MGQYAGKGVFDIWGFSPLFKGIGISIAILNLGFVTYVSTMRYWLLEYLRQSFTTDLPWSSCGHTWNTNSCRSSHILLASSSNETFWNSAANTTGFSNVTEGVSSEEEFWRYKILSLSDGIEDVGSMRWYIVLWAIIMKIIVIICLLKSIKAVGKVWLEATFMAFYSLGPGWEGVMMMGSHMKFHSNCLRNILLSVTGDACFAIFSSVVLFAVLGVMANEIGVSVENVVKSGLSIGLVGYSRALTFLPAPYIWAVVFFFAVTIVGFDAEVVCLETVMSFLERFGAILGRRTRLYLVLFVSLFTFVFNLPFCTQAGPYMFQLIDWYLPTWSVVLIALLEVIAIMWFYGGDRVDYGLKDMIGRKMPHVFRLVAAYISPILLLLLILTSFVTYRPPKYGSYTYPDIGWMISCSVVMPIPLHIVWQFFNLQGTLKERWTTLTQSSSDWGPSDSAHRLDYLERSQTERSFTYIAYYNLFGRQRYSAKKHCETVALY